MPLPWFLLAANMESLLPEPAEAVLIPGLWVSVGGKPSTAGPAPLLSSPCSLLLGARALDGAAGLCLEITLGHVASFQRLRVSASLCPRAVAW